MQILYKSLEVMGVELSAEMLVMFCKAQQPMENFKLHHPPKILYWLY